MVESPTGYPAAQYALGEGSDQVGRISVWSQGARKDGSWTVIHLGLEITNTSDEILTVSIDDVELRSIVSETQNIDVLAQSSHTGQPEIPPLQVGSIEFEFLTNRDVEPTSLVSFAARWVVHNEREGMYRNLTVFQADSGHYGYGYWGYPYWWGPYGYGWYYW